MLFEGPWKIGEGDMGTSLWDGKPTMTIASLRLDGSGWSQSWQFVVTRENLWLCAGCEGEEIIVFFIRYPRAQTRM